MNPLQPPRKSRWIVVPFVLVAVLAAGWTAFWFHAAAAARAAIADWQDQEARVGHNYSCGSHDFGGYPFRIEVRCGEAVAELRTAQGPVVIKVNPALTAAHLHNIRRSRTACCRRDFAP